MRSPATRYPVMLVAVALAALGGCDARSVDQTLEAARGLLAEPVEDVEVPEDRSSLGPESATRLYYQFVDQRGRVRFVERLADVPEAWRERVGFVEMSVPPPLTPGDARRAREGFANARRAAGSEIVKASGPPTVIFYSARWCGWCRKARSHMDREGIRYELRDIDTPSVLQELVAKTGQKGIPAFDVDGRILTGFDPDSLERLVASL